jgi:hypothetical protein
LEIGTFYGRSTATIYAAIRSLRSHVKFITIDLDLHSEEQVEKTFGEIHGTGTMSVLPECEEAFRLGLSSTAYAKFHMERRGLWSCGPEIFAKWQERLSGVRRCLTRAE